MNHAQALPAVEDSFCNLQCLIFICSASINPTSYHIAHMQLQLYFFEQSTSKIVGDWRHRYHVRRRRRYELESRRYYRHRRGGRRSALVFIGARGESPSSFWAAPARRSTYLPLEALVLPRLYLSIFLAW